MPNNSNEFKQTLLSFFREIAHTIVSTLIITFFIYYFIATPNKVQGISMLPNVEENELILTNRIKQLFGNTAIGENFDYDYKRGEVVIFKLPGKEPYIKRVIGLPGEEVMIKDNSVYINGKKLEEEYIPKDVPTRPMTFLREERKVIVPENSYVMLGDNRQNSVDSRFVEVSFVRREYIIGPAAFRLLPFNKFGTIPVGQAELISED